MRIVFCGSGAMAVPVLREVHSSGHELVRVITQPPRRAGRGAKLRETPIALAAGDAGLDVAQCADINAPGEVAELESLGAEVLCVVDFGQLIRKPARRAVRLSAFNLHGSILPDLRGAAPINWAIIRGYEKTGATTFELVDKMDAGPVYLRAGLDIRPNETAEELRERIGELGAKLVCDTLDLIASGEASPVQQDHAKATLAPKLRKADGAIDWNAPAVDIRNLAHGTWPWPGARSIFVRQGDGREVPVTIARAAAIPGDADDAPGTLDGDLSVATGKGRLEIRRLTPAGKRLMDWRDFVNGYRLRPGDRFLVQR